jgi:tRNA threonylcarbamoyladenosine biosynthesis protein TsaB
MRIMALDTSTRSTVVALAEFPYGHAIELRDDPAPPSRPAHASRLLTLAVTILEQAGTNWDGIDRLAVGIGPGTFTGLRIGIATARALARSRAIPLVGVSTLESLALAAAATATAGGHGTVLAVLDARRREAFTAAWRVTPQATLGERVIAAAAVGPERLAGDVAGLPAPVLAIGDGAIEFRPVLERSGALVPEDRSGLHRVSAIHHCRLAMGEVAGEPDQVRPAYLRLPDAEIARRAHERT